MEIRCTGNNGNGCFMDSCGHNCNCEGINQTQKLYKHYKNNKLYLVEDECKIQVSGTWIDAIIYREYGYIYKYCRSRMEFFEKFKLEE